MRTLAFNNSTVSRCPCINHRSTRRTSADMWGEKRNGAAGWESLRNFPGKLWSENGNLRKKEDTERQEATELHQNSTTLRFKLLKVSTSLLHRCTMKVYYHHPPNILIGSHSHPKYIPFVRKLHMGPTCFCCAGQDGTIRALSAWMGRVY